MLPLANRATLSPCPLGAVVAVAAVVILVEVAEADQREGVDASTAAPRITSAPTAPRQLPDALIALAPTSVPIA